MMINKNIFWTIFILAIVFNVIVKWEVIRKLREELSETKENLETIQNECTRYQTLDSLNVIRVGRLTLSKNELKKRESELLEKVEKLDIRLRHMNAIIETKSEANAEVITILRDSIINDTTLIKCLTYDDNYFKIDACIKADTLTGTLAYRDTLIQVFHRVPRRFWFIKFGTKAIKQDAYLSNRNASIVYSKFITLKRRRK